MDSGVIIGLIGSVISVVITTTVGILIKRWFAKRDQQEAEAAEKAKQLQALEETRKNEQLRQAMADQCASQICAFKKELKPIITTLETIEGGTLSSLRNDILTCYYHCLEKGYRNDWDYTNIHDLFEAYEALGGNTFIADVMQRFDALPTKEEFNKEGK